MVTKIQILSKYTEG